MRELALYFHEKMILLKKNLFHLLDSILKMKFLTLGQKQFYKENGFIKLDNIFNFEEINQISEDYDDLFQVVPIPICILADRANISTNFKKRTRLLCRGKIWKMPM